MLFLLLLTLLVASQYSQSSGLGKVNSDEQDTRRWTGYHDNTIVAQKTHITPYTLGVKVVDVDYIIDQLNKCENFGRWDDNIVLDTNKRYSYGGLQFQMTTFISQGILYGVLPADITIEDAREIIHLEPLQREIAKGMIKDRKAHTTLGWFNCWRKMGLSY